MRVWLVNIFEDMPSVSYAGWRMGSLVQALVDVGHQVTWWTSDWSHSSKSKRHEPSADEYPWEVISVSSAPYLKNVSLQRFNSHKQYARDWKAFAISAIRSGELEKPDVVVVNCPPPVVAAAVAELKREVSFCMVCDIRDAWPEAFSQAIPGSNYLSRALLRLITLPFSFPTRKAYRDADVFSAVSQDYLDVAAKYVPKNRKDERVFFIGCKSSQLNKEPAEYQLRDRKVFKLVYVGSQSSSYDLFTVVKALAHPELSDAPIELHFAGRGDAIPMLEKLVAKLGLKSIVTFHGELRLEELRGLLESCHVGLNALKRASWIAMPNKIGDYFAAGLPVLHSLETGELAMLIRERDMGRCFRAGSVASCANAIRHCIENREHLAVQSKNARRFALTSLDRTKIYPDMVRWLESLHSNRLNA